MARNSHVSFARPDSPNVPFSPVHPKRSDEGAYEEQQPSSAQEGGQWASSLPSSSVPRGYPAESYVPPQHQHHPAYQHHNGGGVGHPHPRAGWHPLPGSTASAQGDGSAECAVADPVLWGRPAQARPRPPRGPPGGDSGRLPAVSSTAASPGAPMQLMHSDLAVLNAEQYGDGCGGGPRIASSAAPRKAPPPTVVEEPAPKKRGRGSAQPAAKAKEPEEDKKRARGRPRLEPTSETPQERRRTQIRLAQRAYRDRKEGAISTLEKEVEDLKAKNAQVTQAYQELLARVQGGGSLDNLGAGPVPLPPPPLGALAKRPAHDGSASSNSPPSDAAQPAKRARREASLAPLSASMAMTTTRGPVPRPDPAAVPQPTPLWAGVMVAPEPLVAPSASAYPPACVGPEFFGGGAAGAPGGYEVLAQATPQNASFAPPLAFDVASWALAGGAGASPAASPFSLVLPAAPASFAYQEPTFGRRLHRSLLQRAARLATMAHPPPAALARVFGFAMLFESLDQIKARTLALLSPAERASLFEDRYPFQNLGGAGSHYPAVPPSGGDPQQPPPPSSSASTTPPRRSAAAAPVDRDPYAMGPMDPRVAKIRDTLVSLGGQIALPGFDGIFWDPEEVDFYLRHNGVVIPPAADHHIVEIPDGAFGPPPSSSPSATSTAASTGDADGASVSSSSAITAGSSLHDHPVAPAAPPAQKAMPPADAGWSLADDFFDAHGETTTMAAVAPSDLTYTYDGHGHSGAGASDLNLAMYMAQPPRRVWRMDVERFVDNLTAKTTCLGRSPGIRPGDVDAAFWASVSDPASDL